MTTYYFVTDIETDGPDPSLHSMLSFATVVLRDNGEFVDEFEANLEPRSDRTQDQQTMSWWGEHPQAWAAATKNPMSPSTVMKKYVNWVEGFDGLRSFAARPLLFDGLWMDHYLRAFGNSYVLDMPYGSPLFTAAAMDIPTYMSGLFGRSSVLTVRDKIPADWFGDHQHTHTAIDDARGYASVLAHLLKIADETPPHPLDFGKTDT